MENTGNLIIRGGRAILDFLFPVYDKPYGHALDPSCGKTLSYFSPKYRGKFKSYDAVQDPSCLLGVNQVLVHGARILYCVKYGVLGYFVENYPVGVFRLESQTVLKMPRYGLSLTVLIACQIDNFSLVCQSLEFGNDLFLVCRNLIGRLESVFYVYAKCCLGQIAYVSEA